MVIFGRPRSKILGGIRNATRLCMGYTYSSIIPRYLNMFLRAGGGVSVVMNSIYNNHLVISIYMIYSLSVLGSNVSLLFGSFIC